MNGDLMGHSQSLPQGDNGCVLAEAMTRGVDQYRSRIAETIYDGEDVVRSSY